MLSSSVGPEALEHLLLFDPVDLGVLQQCANTLQVMDGAISPEECRTIVSLAEQYFARQVGKSLLIVAAGYCEIEDGELHDVSLYGTYHRIKLSTLAKDGVCHDSRVGLVVAPLDTNGNDMEYGGLLDFHGVGCLYEEVAFPINHGNNVAVGRAPFEAPDFA